MMRSLAVLTLVLWSLRPADTTAQDWELVRDFGSYVEDIAVTPDGTVLAALLHGDVFRHSDDAWSRVLEDASVREFAVQDLGVGGPSYLAASAGGVFRSGDDGRTWDLLMPSEARSIYAEGVLAVAGGRGGQLYVSEDSGKSWTVATCDLMPDGVDYVVDPVTSVSGTHLFGHFLDGTYRKEPDGEWTHNEGFDPDFFAQVSGALFANDGIDLMRSADGEAWDVVGELPSFGSDDFDARGDIMLVATASGAAASFDSGASWHAVGSDLADSFVESVAIDTSGHALIGTDCCLYRSAQPISEEGTSGKNDRPEMLTDGLGPVFPNPASDVVRIPLTVSRPSHVEVIVADELGRRVSLLLSRDVPPGMHRLEWDTRHVASGRYTIRASIGAAVFSETVIVAR